MVADRLSWKVTNTVVDQTTNDTAGNVLVGSYIYYITGDGNRGVVFVENDKLKLDHVQAVIRHDARRLDQIGRLAENYVEG